MYIYSDVSEFWGMEVSEWVSGRMNASIPFIFFSGLGTLNKMDSPDSFELGSAGCLLSLTVMALSQYCHHFCTEYLASLECR